MTLVVMPPQTAKKTGTFEAGLLKRLAACGNLFVQVGHLLLKSLDDLRYGGSFMVTYPVSQPPNLDGPSTQSWREAVLPGKHVDCPLSLQVMSLVDIWLGIQESNQCSINKKMHKECTTKASSIVLLRLVISLLTAANFSSKAWCK